MRKMHGQTTLRFHICGNHLKRLGFRRVTNQIACRRPISVKRHLRIFNRPGFVHPWPWVGYFFFWKGWRNGLLLCNVSFHCRVHSIRSLVPNLSRRIISSTPRHSMRSLSVRFNNKNYVCISLFPYVCCVSCESCHWLFNRLDSIRRRAVCLAAHYVMSLRLLSFCCK